MISVALPKGRLGDKVYALFSSVGYECFGLSDESRKLVFEDKRAGVRYLFVKPMDVAVYVERGAADVGVIGRDILLETEPDVYELLDLGLGRCKLAVAAPVGFEDDFGTALRVATKYPHVTQQHYQKLERDIEIIKLNGSIELAPILGLSDVIVDIVETGTTLRENNLKVYDCIAQSSAQIIANKRSYTFLQKEITQLIDAIMGATT